MSERFEKWFGIKDEPRNRHGQLLVKQKEQSSEKKEGMLSALEKELMKTSIDVLAKYLTGLSDEDLPKGVVYMDTAARPIAYAISPVLKAIYSGKNIPVPKSLYMKILRTRSPQDDVDEDVRAKEIIDQLGLTSRDPLLLVDDYIIRGRTLDLAINAFGKHLDKPRITAFSVLAHPALVKEFEKNTETDKEENFRYIQNGSTFQYNMRYGDGRRFKNKNEVRFLFGEVSGDEFSYRKQKTEAIGVKAESGSKYSQLLETRDTEKMRALRSEMSEVGNKVVESLHLNPSS